MARNSDSYTLVASGFQMGPMGPWDLRGVNKSQREGPTVQGWAGILRSASSISLHFGFLVGRTGMLALTPWTEAREE